MSTIHLDALMQYGSTRRAAEALGLAYTTFFDRLSKERKALSAIQNAEEPIVDPVRYTNKPRYYIFSCAVKGATVHEDFLKNLEAYAAHLGADIAIGPLTSTGRQRYTEYDPEDFDPAIVDYIHEEAIVIGNKIRFSPELNLTPTMVKPLQGLQTYTKKLWGIFPHTKISLETVATHKDRPTKFIATTGAITHPHYSPTKAGFRAHFDHVHGAIIVEVTKTGVWFRHLTPANALDGTFYDLGYVVKNGKVLNNKEGVRAIVYGDIHIELIDKDVAKATWGIGFKSHKDSLSLVDWIKPQTQVFHDLLDMTAANYHELDNMFRRYERWNKGKNSVHGDLEQAMEFLRQVTGDHIESVVVDSNHDYFIQQWLLKFDPAAKEDFDNIETFYKLKIAVLRSIREGFPLSFLETILREKFPGEETLLDNITFLKVDDSFEIDNIECGWHGHRGANGRRGSRHAFKFVTEKSTIAHLHSPAIESGCHVVGTSSSLDLGYNSGPSSWAHTHGIIYPHGGRTLITMSDSKFWAAQGIS